MGGGKSDCHGGADSEINEAFSVARSGFFKKDAHPEASLCAGGKYGGGGGYGQQTGGYTPKPYGGGGGGQVRHLSARNASALPACLGRPFIPAEIFLQSMLVHCMQSSACKINVNVALNDRIGLLLEMSLSCVDG